MDESAPSSSNLVSDQHGPGLRRDLGRLQSYATLIGIFIGAGAFVVTDVSNTHLTLPTILLV